jgi:Transposase DDE domain
MAKPAGKTQPVQRAKLKPGVSVSQPTRAQLETVLSAFPKRKVHRWARQAGFGKHPQKLTPFEFLMLMVWGQMASVAPSLEALVTFLDHRIGRVALHYRLNRAASEFLWTCLEWVLEQGRQVQLFLQSGWLESFPRILIHDSSSWDLPAALQSVFAGSGGSASPANCKLHLTYELKRGLLNRLRLTAGKDPDQAFGPQLLPQIRVKDLVITDLGFFSLRFFAALTAQGAYFLSRFLIGTQLRTADTGQPIDLARVLRKATADAYQHRVLMGSGAGVACRLIGLRVPEPIAQRRRRQLKKNAQKKGRTPSQLHLQLCDWTLLVTNAAEVLLPAPKIRTFYRLRWQIELIFKQLKSVLRIHQCRTTKKHRLLCELYGKLIAAVLLHSLHGPLQAELWNQHHQALSFDKLWKRVPKRALTLLQASLNSLNQFIRAFLRELPKLLKACLKCRQPSRLTSLELFETIDTLNFEDFPL